LLALRAALHIGRACVTPCAYTGQLRVVEGGWSLSATRVFGNVATGGGLGGAWVFRVNGLITSVRVLLDWQINSAVFMKVNSASINMLRLAGEYVTFGPPNLKTVRELVYKRGFACLNKQRLPLTDNKIISDNLGKHGLTCMEDLVHELYTVGPKFREVNRFLWP